MSRRSLLAAAGGLAAGSLLLPKSARAVLRLDVTQGTPQPIPIAIPEFLGGQGGGSDVGRLLTSVITNNLRRSGLFLPIDPASYIERIQAFDAAPRFPDWRAINAQALVVGRVSREGDGRFRRQQRINQPELAGQLREGVQESYDDVRESKTATVAGRQSSSGPSTTPARRISLREASMVSFVEWK